jgi:TRAP-type C4-dicarboxylate transport system substrate-binding protein
MSLQQGVVDGADTSPDQFVMDKFVEVSKFYNLTKVHYLPALLIVSKSKWDKLTPQQQAIVKSSADEALADSRAYYKKSYADSIERMKKAGVTVVEPNLAPMKQTSSKVDADLLANIPDGKKLYDKVQAAKKG